MRSLLSYFVSKNAKTVKSLGIFKDTETSEYRVFDEQGDIEDLVTAVQGPQGIQGPAGPQGEPGPVGPSGLNWQGAWSASGTYVVDDAVGYNGASWFCISNVGPTATVPSSDPTKWALLAAQGARGATGATGAQGPTGATGPAGPAGSSSYKAYSAILQYTQAGSDISISVVSELENTLGTTISWGYDASSPFAVAGSNVFTSGKTAIIANPYLFAGNLFFNIGTRTQPNIFTLRSVTSSGSGGTAYTTPFFFEIRVYN